MKKSLSTAAKAVFVAILIFCFQSAHAQGFSRTRLALNGGWGDRFARTAPDLDDKMKDMVKGMRSGVQYGADFMVYFSETLGAGLKYNHFSTSYNTSDSTLASKLNTGTDFYGATAGIRLTL